MTVHLQMFEFVVSRPGLPQHRLGYSGAGCVVVEWIEVSQCGLVVTAWLNEHKHLPLKEQIPRFPKNTPQELLKGALRRFNNVSAERATSQCYGK